ncbi:putative mrna binding protein pumilio [Phaeomoniella chlamydospora]|uniref:Pumilio homology domain family member 3 n=1 Tax=Phaeomoniella chlamydospora TaxID=158046 RepID=A0A0G2GZL1_PHACM|nr:putative mrna binding protein pumilio [Phaeomoniella chlamydospora]
MSNGVSVQNSRVHKMGNFEPSSGNIGSSYGMNNGFGSNKSNWAGSIWGNGTLKKTFGDATNEGSNRRGSHSVKTDEVEGKTGSSSLLASSESEGWNRGQGIPWGAVNGTSMSATNQTKPISPVRQRIPEPASTSQIAPSAGRSSSPYFQDGLNSLQQHISPPITNGTAQGVSETQPFANYRNRQSESVASAFSPPDRTGGNDIDFVPAFAQMKIQATEKFNGIQYSDLGSSANSFNLRNPYERQAHPLTQNQEYSNNSVEVGQDSMSQYEVQKARNGGPNPNGFLSPTSGNIRRGKINQSYHPSGTPPNVPDMLNPSISAFSKRVTEGPNAPLDRKSRGLQQLQQEPANFLAGQALQHNNAQSRMQYQNYELSGYPSVRMNPLPNTYGMPSYLGYVQPPVPPPFSTRNEPIRSPLLEEFRTNNRTNRRFELKDIYGHVVEFAGDQHGSRFIQQKLETANSDGKDQIFMEIQPNSLQLMTDLFGNYVIQKLFEHGSQAQKKILANQMKGHVRSLSNQMYGCRVVQKALEHVLTDQQAALISELNTKGLVLECVMDQNGNHVIQKAIERVPTEHIQFIIDAFLGQVAQLATHAYGCRVIQRMLEHCKDPSRRQILEELHACIPTLVIDQFGNYVIQHIIQHGDEVDRSRILSIVVNNVLAFSKHKFASNVVEKSIEYGAPQQRGEILRLLTSANGDGESPVLGLVRDQYGNYVIQKVLNVLKGAERENLINQIRPHLPSLKKVSFSKQIIAIEKIILDADYEANQSSQSSSLPSTNASTVDGPVTPGPSIGLVSPPASISGLVDESIVKTPTGPAVIKEVGMSF